MRSPERLRSALLALAIAAVALPGAAAPEDAKSAIAQRLKQQLPQLAPADYTQGAAYFDEAFRAKALESEAASASVVEAGRKLWTRKFRNGRTLAGCFPNGGRRVAGSYPHYDPRLKLVVTLELAINQCLKAHGEPVYEPGDPQTMGAITAHLRSLSNGTRIAVRVPAAAEEKFEQGRRLYFSRLGQRNYACASCHVQSAGKRFAEVPLSPAIGQATHWPVIRGGGAVTLQMRMRECLELMGAAPFAAGSEELNHLEYFLTYLSNGLTLKANVGRP